MLEKFRRVWTKVITPIAKGLLKVHITPDTVTWVGTIASVVIALLCFPRGWLWPGALGCGVFVLADSLDGTMARLSGKSSKWGAFLDSTLDRLNDGAIFGSIALYYAGDPSTRVWCGVAIAALVFGQVTSYTKARGESLGYQVNAGIAGRADRLVIGLLGALLTGVGLALALPIALVILLVLGVATVGQRMAIVARQYHKEDE
uniref:phosphatidylinositol phosphate synthase n=1 Tax=Vaginimicrobium propionicum TaxID=1871034 RepID=UPI0009710A85|nr:CDP-alcohol phosphatidyltransferase family protein [Vaginimicrobium propionicum]